MTAEIKITAEIQSLAMFAQRINFDVINGDVQELARLWYKQCVTDYQLLTDKDNWSTVYGILQNRCGLK